MKYILDEEEMAKLQQDAQRNHDFTIQFAEARVAEHQNHHQRVLEAVRVVAVGSKCIYGVDGNQLPEESDYCDDCPLSRLRAGNVLRNNGRSGPEASQIGQALCNKKQYYSK